MPLPDISRQRDAFAFGAKQTLASGLPGEFMSSRQATTAMGLRVAQNGQMSSALSSIANVDRRLWMRRPHADTVAPPAIATPS
jgi:hypothetical protein